LRAGQNLSDRTEAIRRFLQTAALALQARQMDSVSRTVVLGRFSELLGISVSRIEQEIAAILKQKRRRSRPDAADEQVDIDPDERVDLASKAQREILEAVLGHPDCFGQVAARVSVSDFGPDEQLRELAEAIFGLFAGNAPLQLSQLYGRVESSAAGNLLTELQAAAEQKTNLLSQLDGALAALENRTHSRRIQLLKQGMDKDNELKQMLSQIAQKGPNLRNAGI
ncbi:MAG: hypothetical protein DRP56_03555, partial [Planctomycetota bacterium]